MIRLSDDETGMLAGARGPAAALSMRVILAAARIQGAERLLPIESAHVDSCLYHGPSSLDFARALLSGGGRVRVPTTLNVGGLDRSRPDLFAGPASHGEAARQLMDCYVELGCQPTFTCAPYQLPGRPAPGTDVAWAESNAIVFGNSMIGLRTNRYGDLIDICAAITGRVPHAGLHIRENRAGRALFTVEQDALSHVDADLLPALLGHHVGRRTGTLIPVLDGLQAVPVTEDWGKAFGAAAASSGGVAMFHIVGATPEAPDLATATQGKIPALSERVSGADLMAAHRQLTTGTPADRLGGVSIGTPHLSAEQLGRLAAQLAGRRVRVPTYATTSRSVIASDPAAVQVVEAAGVTIIRDTCTYFQASFMSPDGVVMTNSAKWAYYAPAKLGCSVILASQTDCVASAVSGEITLTSHHG
ncbi:MAG TPA: aconitase X catalytic domain-containing protein [Streptosporangiaceae bacterium]|nr:aconitase X catalytic domain-containing protein [Streptosporangiaceae bacterium]